MAVGLMTWEHKVYELKQVYATPHYLLVAIMNEYWAAHNRCQKTIMVMMRFEFAPQNLQTEIDVISL